MALFFLISPPPEHQVRHQDGSTIIAMDISITKATGIDHSTLIFIQRSANADKGNFVRGTHLLSEKPRQLTMVVLCPCMPHNGRYSYAYRLDGVRLMYC